MPDDDDMTETVHRASHSAPPGTALTSLQSFDSVWDMFVRNVDAIKKKYDQSEAAVSAIDELVVLARPLQKRLSALERIASDDLGESVNNSIFMDSYEAKLHFVKEVRAPAAGECRTGNARGEGAEGEGERGSGGAGRPLALVLSTTCRAVCVRTLWCCLHARNVLTSGAARAAAERVLELRNVRLGEGEAVPEGRAEVDREEEAA